ncbi:MAG: PDZ domain-containing protein [Propioniciclava sp.]|uniref:YlbL family protein n=1 Tax=Propioniciclava sp. TaxID=2038686 RepID=UPI0039E6DFF0
MTRQTWTAAVSALLFVLAAAVVAMTPVPYVTYAPGQTYDLLGSANGRPIVEVDGLDVYRDPGGILLTTVNITRPDVPVGLPELLYAHGVPDREVFPREFVYPGRSTAGEIQARESQELTTSRADASAAALRAAKIEVTQIPMVQSVNASGPAANKLIPGDFVLAVDGVDTPTTESVRAAVEDRAVGAPVTFTILRDRIVSAVTVETTGSKTQARVPVWGGTLGMGYSYDPRVTINVDQGVAGSSAGLMMALAVYDLITPGGIVGARVVAGTGAIDGGGTVHEVGGVRQKLAGAQNAGAEIFFVPAENCVDLATATTSVRVVSVRTLQDAINALIALGNPATESQVEGCS